MSPLFKVRELASGETSAIEVLANADKAMGARERRVHSLVSYLRATGENTR